MGEVCAGLRHAGHMSHCSHAGSIVVEAIGIDVSVIMNGSPAQGVRCKLVFHIFRLILEYR